MVESREVLENLRENVSGKVYDAVDAATKVPIALQQEVDKLKAELAATVSKIHQAQRQLIQSPTTKVSFGEPAVLSEDLQLKSEGLKKCLAMSARMTACQLDANERLVCGGVFLRPGSTADELQANWDLIDTVTGADA
jgi:hypothetical protein